MNKNSYRLLWWVALVALLLITFTLRTWALLDIPPGLTHDEAGNGHDSAAILHGVLRIYFPVGYGREPLFNYSLALMTTFLGEGIFTLRITTVLWSVLLWALIVALARRWWGRRAALFAAATLTAAFWPLMVARTALRATTLPVMISASIWAFDYSLRAATSRARWRWYAAAGGFLGLGFYTYMASRGLPAIYLAFLPLMALLNRPVFRKHWPGALLAVAIALLIGAPLFIHLRLNPGLEYRLTQLGGPLTALRAGDPRPALHNIWLSLGMFYQQGDPLWLYNISGRPALEIYLSAALLIGAGVALLRLRAPRYTLLWLWLGAGLLPALITGPEATALRSLAALPAIILLIALGWEELWQRAAATRSTRALALGLLPLLLLVTLNRTAHAYFVDWGQHPDVRTLYHHQLVALGRALAASPERTPVVISSFYPGEFHDPYTMEVTLRGDALPLHWATGSHALFFPPGATRLVTNTLTPLDAALAPLLRAHGAPLDQIVFRSDDLIRELHFYRWDAEAAWTALQPQLATMAYTAPGDPPPGVAHTAHALPLTFGESVALMGYQVTPEAPHPGETLTIITTWRIERAVAEELVAFTHLLSPEGALIAQDDRLDAPNWQWQPGDRFVQLHRFTIPAETPPGAYALQVGFYTREGWHRLPIGSSEPPTTRALLAPLEISAP